MNMNMNMNINRRIVLVFFICTLAASIFAEGQAEEKKQCYGGRI